MWIWIWLGIIVVSLIFEFITMELVTIWFAFGGLVGLILSAFDPITPTVQIIVFLIVSFALLLSCRKVAQRFLSRNDNTKTNTDSIIGEQYKLLTDITEDHLGTIKVNDVVWSATTSNQTEIKAGKYVIAKAIKGNKIIVEEKK